MIGVKQISAQEALLQASEFGQQMCENTQYLGEFNIEVFVEFYTAFLSTGRAQIFMLCNEDTMQAYGGLGAGIFQDPHTGEKVCQTMFIYIKPEYRGHARSLLKYYEKWAIEKGCKKVLISHFLDYEPDKMSAFYRAMGFQAMEVFYSKRI